MAESSTRTESRGDAPASRKTMGDAERAPRAPSREWETAEECFFLPSGGRDRRERKRCDTSRGVLGDIICRTAESATSRAGVSERSAFAHIVDCADVLVLERGRADPYMYGVLKVKPGVQTVMHRDNDVDGGRTTFSRLRMVAPDVSCRKMETLNNDMSMVFPHNGDAWNFVFENATANTVITGDCFCLRRVGPNVLLAMATDCIEGSCLGGAGLVLDAEGEKRAAGGLTRLLLSNKLYGCEFDAKSSEVLHLLFLHLYKRWGFLWWMGDDEEEAESMTDVSNNHAYLQDTASFLRQRKYFSSDEDRTEYQSRFDALIDGEVGYCDSVWRVLEKAMREREDGRAPDVVALLTGEFDKLHGKWQSSEELSAFRAQKVHFLELADQGQRGRSSAASAPRGTTQLTAAGRRLADLLKQIIVLNGESDAPRRELIQVLENVAKRRNKLMKKHMHLAKPKIALQGQRLLNSIAKCPAQGSLRNVQASTRAILGVARRSQWNDGWSDSNPSESEEELQAGSDMETGSHEEELFGGGGALMRSLDVGTCSGNAAPHPVETENKMDYDTQENDIGAAIYPDTELDRDGSC
eukprot:TRINITY_DN24973_c0_g2_i1.p1 TRINITY_DN24973_c0_g2~~TRINITY_DN24973_c0_g2_i1.p1  ORF type:complete len:634 (-),score=101.92 TRINITY_DN24973_c0_g2_i1:1559-3304(-)